MYVNKNKTFTHIYIIIKELKTNLIYFAIITYKL